MSRVFWLAALYAILGMVWVYAGGELVNSALGDRDSPALRIIKAILYILVTACIFALFTVRLLRRREALIARLNQSEAQLEEDVVQYRALFNANPCPLWVFDVETLMFLAVNEATVRQYGYSEDEFLTMSIKEIRPASEANRLEEYLKGLASGYVDAGIWQHVRRDGSLLDVRISTHALVYNGRPARLVLAIDVTEELAAHGYIADLNAELERDKGALQSAKAESDLLAARLQHYLSVGPGVLYSLTMHGETIQSVWASDSITRMTGYSVEEATSPEWWAAHVHPDDFNRIEAGKVTAIRLGYVQSEYRFFKRDGTYIWVRDELRRVSNQGDTVELVGMWMDISESKAQEAQLRLQSAAVEAAANAIVISDTRGRIERANPAFTAMTGYTEPEYLGRGFGELLNSNVHDEAFFRALWETITAGRVWQGEIINKKKDGTLYTEDQTIAPVRDWDGTITHFIAVKQDVSQKKLAEKERADTEAQLRQAQKMEVVGMLAGGVAHDFNNMLSIIMGYAEDALDAAKDSETQSSLTAVVDAARRSAELTQRLLAFSKKQPTEAMALDAVGILRGHHKMLSRIIGTTATLRLEVEADPLFVEMEPVQIGQIVTNLVVNARDALGEGNGGEILMGARRETVETERQMAVGVLSPGDYAVLTVRDTGAGMTADTLAKVFDPFFTTKAPGRGTGLGLSTIASIVKDQGGAIHVGSQVGQGTHFDVYLPICSGAEKAELQPSMPAEKSGDGTGSQGKCVLVVEDEAPLLMLDQKVLERAGYRVMAAGSPEVALSLASALETCIDVLVTDMIMPGMNGRQLHDVLAERYPAMRTVYMSGHSAETLWEGKVPGHDFLFLQKPFMPRELVTRVQAAMGQSHS